MGTYIIRRILIAIPVLIGITIVSFVALSLAPGDPLLARLAPEQLFLASVTMVPPVPLIACTGILVAVLTAFVSPPLPTVGTGTPEQAIAVEVAA